MAGTKGMNKGKDNGLWKENVSYKGLHQWVRRNLPKKDYCENCFKSKDRLDAANISGNYKRDLNDYKWLCRSCHMKEDGRLKNINNQKGFKPNKKQLEVLRLGREKRWL